MTKMKATERVLEALKQGYEVWEVFNPGAVRTNAVTCLPVWVGHQGAGPVFQTNRQTMNALRRQGLVTKRHDGDRTVYRLTRKGEV